MTKYLYIWVRAYIDFQWPHLLNGCLLAILDFSVSGWHGFSSVTQICFGISVLNFMCISLVAVGRSLTIVSNVLLSTHCPLPPSPMGRGILVDHWSTISSFQCQQYFVTMSHTNWLTLTLRRPYMIVQYQWWALKIMCWWITWIE